MKFLPTITALLMAAGLVALGTMSFHSGTAKSRPVVLPFEVFWCKSDADCSIVDGVGCCDCSQGGAQVAITDWRRDDLRRFLKRACPEEQVCVQVDTCRSHLHAACRHRRCVLEVKTPDSKHGDGG